MFWERFSALCQEKGYSPNGFAAENNISTGTITNWKNGKIPSAKLLKKVADNLGVTTEYLTGKSEKKTKYDLPPNVHPIKTKKFPLLGEIACGEPIFADEDHSTYIEASADIKADFCLAAKGDSMIGARIQDGDVVFILEQQIVNNGEIAAVIIDDEATLKRWYYDEQEKEIMLVAENPKYKPLVYRGEELEKIRCLGKAVCFMSKI